VKGEIVDGRYSFYWGSTNLSFPNEGYDLHPDPALGDLSDPTKTNILFDIDEQYNLVYYGVTDSDQTALLCCMLLESSE